MDRVYAVKCLVKNEFEPTYDNYSSYEEVTYLLPADALFGRMSKLIRTN
ncbi:hypothetical protein [Streptococcus suis]